MPALIKNRTRVADRWRLLRDAATLADVPPQGAVIVALGLWVASAPRCASAATSGCGSRPPTTRRCSPATWRGCR